MAEQLFHRRQTYETPRPTRTHQDEQLHLRDIAARLVITKGKKKGQHPSPSYACSASTTSKSRPPTDSHLRRPDQVRRAPCTW
ncbi:hypothetical protein [Nonomuraea dietziae]|uniref:hypothetical protein n=1 Tax=Nonomuraea dietziae TaxID=65515 RepID=UPI0031CE727C